VTWVFLNGIRLKVCITVFVPQNTQLVDTTSQLCIDKDFENKGERDGIERR
jgi:hypothetical protein